MSDLIAALAYLNSYEFSWHNLTNYKLKAQSECEIVLFGMEDMN